MKDSPPPTRYRVPPGGRPSRGPAPEEQAAGPAPQDSPIEATRPVLREALDRGVTEVLMEPAPSGARVRWRVDGALLTAPEPVAQAFWTARGSLATLARFDPNERLLPQFGSVELQVHGHNVRLGVRSLPGVSGTAYALDLNRLDPVRPMQLADLGMDPVASHRMTQALASRGGLIVVAGPTRSGKTVTLYAALRSLVSPTTVALTIEDPVQEQVEGAIQMECRCQRGLDFPAALHVLKARRPEALLVQELRDYGTLEQAVQAAMHGSLVLSSLHTSDAPSTLCRLVDMGLEPYLAALSVQLVQAQRLLRRVCPACAVSQPLDATTRQSLRLTDKLLTRLELEPALGQHPNIRRGSGCVRCHGTGFQGVSLVCESLAMTGPIRELVRHSAPTDEVRQEARAAGMLTLREAALRQALLGVTTLDEAVLWTPRTPA